LATADFDIDLLGFDSKFLDALFEEEQEEDDFVVDEEDGAPGDYVSEYGDEWLLGEHRVMCGDSTSVDDVVQLMDGMQCDMVWSDPPYKVAYDGDDGMTIENDDMNDSDFDTFLLEL